MKTRLLTSVFAGVVAVFAAIECAGQESFPNSATQRSRSQDVWNCAGSNQACASGNGRFVLVGFDGGDAAVGIGVDLGDFVVEV